MTDDLTPDQEAADTEGRLAEAIDILRAPVDTDARAFDARVLAEVDRQQHQRSVPRAWIWSIPAALAAALVIGVALTRSASTSRSSRASAAGTEVVHFQLAGIHAHSVAVAGTFNRWNPYATPLHRAADGSWTADVALTPGRHEYQFVIDQARWIPDPRSPRDPSDDFGAPNSVITVLGPGRGS